MWISFLVVHHSQPKACVTRAVFRRVRAACSQIHFDDAVCSGTRSLRPAIERWLGQQGRPSVDSRRYGNLADQHTANYDRL